MKIKQFSSQPSGYESTGKIKFKSTKPTQPLIILLLPVLLLQLCIACTNKIIMQAKYEDEIPGAVPITTPSPNPPQDNFAWGVIDVTPVIVSLNGGKEVMVTPKESYYVDGKYRAFVLNAFTDATTVGKTPGIRGGVTVKMQGFGTMVISLHASQSGNNQGNDLGGFLFGDVGTPSIGYMTAQNLKVMEANNTVLNSTGLSYYESGLPVQLNWSINQSSHTLSLTATPEGGNRRSADVTFDPIVTNGAPNSPIEKILITVEMFQVARGTRVFFDDFYGEEY
jgi:hypothetical protein